MGYPPAGVPPCQVPPWPGLMGGYLRWGTPLARSDRGVPKVGYPPARSDWGVPEVGNPPPLLGYLPPSGYPHLRGYPPLGYPPHWGTPPGWTWLGYPPLGVDRLKTLPSLVLRTRSVIIAVPSTEKPGETTLPTY